MPPVLASAANGPIFCSCIIFRHGPLAPNYLRRGDKLGMRLATLFIVASSLLIVDGVVEANVLFEPTELDAYGRIRKGVLLDGNNKRRILIECREITHRLV
jgi:hypothetical protein